MQSSRVLAVVLILGIAVLPAEAGRKKKAAEAAPPETAVVAVPPAAAAAGPPPPATPAVEPVAWVGDEAIALAAVDLAIAGELGRIHQEEYEARRTALDQMVTQKLIEREAASRGITPEALVAAEVESKTTPPTDDAVNQFYESNKARMGGRSLEEVSADIRRLLQQQQAQAIGNAYFRGLAETAGVRILLDPPRTEVQIPAGAPARGAADAKVTVVEFADFQCPYCKQAQPVLEEILKSHGDRIRFVFGDYPLPNHPRAFPASRAARCAGDQGKYWEYHDGLMKGTGDLGDEDLKKRASDVGLDVEAFSACYASGAHDGAIRASADAGSLAGVTGTPTFFVNGRMIVGAQPVEEFRRVIDEELERAAPSGPRAHP